jgi:hypothetical protein
MGWVASPTPRPLYLQERPDTNCTLCGPQSQSGQMGKMSSHRDLIQAFLVKYLYENDYKVDE